MYCLAMFLPLIIGTLIPEEDKHWKLFCLLLDIVDIIFTQKTTVYSIGILEGYIEEHHTTFIHLYPGRSIIPKMHYLVHYPSHMLRYSKHHYILVYNLRQKKVNSQ